MEPSHDISVIINPASASGKTSRKINAYTCLLERAFPGRCTYSFTQGPGDGVRLGAQAIVNSMALIIAVGGDGTVHEVVNGMLGTGGGELHARLGILSSGSGQGFALSAGLPPRIEDQVALLARGESRLVDVGAITARSPEGNVIGRYFINESQIGIGASVVARTTVRRKRAGGLLAYGLATLAEILRCPNRRFQLILDEAPPVSASLIGLSMGNGARTAGGMALTPAAEFDDALLDLLLIHHQGIPRRLRSFPRIYSGKHVHTSEFSVRKFTTLDVCCDDDVPVAADGEILGTLPATIRILPRALHVILPPSKGAPAS